MFIELRAPYINLVRIKTSYLYEFPKKNKLNIIVFIVILIFFFIFDNGVETNDQVIEESFRWSRAIITCLVVAGWNLLNHYFLKNK